MIVEKHYRWWKNKKTFIAAITLLAAITFFIYLGYHFQWSWTGFNEFRGPDTQQYQPVKKLWDWMQLLIVPAVLAVAALLLNYAMSQNEREEIKDRAKTDGTIALDNQRETLLQNYLDNMSELLLTHHLRDPNSCTSGAKDIARARTLTVLSGLDPTRKGNIIRFLYDSQLITLDSSTSESVINLKGANLNGANLNRANLMEANLKGADLSNADLSFARLDKANFEEACLSEANLTGTQLSDANLTAAKLGGAKLKAANLKRSHLNDADLRTADLYSSNLNRANLSGANLSKLDLREVSFDTIIINAETNIDGIILSEEQKRIFRKVKSGSL
jgi:uncharacterized protein YjbI with pentapeptide repeats